MAEDSTVAHPTSPTPITAAESQPSVSAAARIVLEGDGQEFDLPIELVETDVQLADALVGAYPDIRGARIERRTEEGRLVITITKRSGPKGYLASAQMLLRRAPRQLNPAVSLCLQLRQLESSGALEPELLVSLDAAIRQAIEDGEREGKSVAVVNAALAKCSSVPSITVPAGF